MLRPAGRLHKRIIEPIVGTILLAIPLFYLLTFRSAEVTYFDRYSPRLAALIVLYATAMAIYLVSYRWPLWRVLETARSYAVVGLFALFMSGVVGEVFLRVIDRPPYAPTNNGGRHKYDPDLGHVYVPNHRQMLQTREWRQEWRSNAEGVRADRDYGPKPDGVTRILVLGDSFTVGDQVPLEDTYPGVMQRLFDRHRGARAVEVINAGFPSYGTIHAARYLDKFGVAFAPDIIIFGATPNDLVENINPLATIARDGALVRADATDGQIAAWYDRTRWYSLPGYWQRSFFKRRLDILWSRVTVGPPYVHRRAFMVAQDAESIDLYDVVYRQIDHMRARARSIGAAFVIMAIPLREQFGSMGDGLDPSLYGRRLGAYAAQNNIRFLDLYPLFADHPNPANLYWAEDIHCTAAGYELIGRSLYNFLNATP